MCAIFQNRSPPKNVYFVRILYGTESVGNTDNCSVLAGRFDGAKDCRLGCRVERTSRFIEDQYRRVLDGRPSNSYSLFLSARELSSSVADVCVVTLNRKIVGPVRMDWYGFDGEDPPTRHTSGS